MTTNKKKMIPIFAAALAVGVLVGCGSKADVPIEMVFVEGGTFAMGCTPEQGGYGCFNLKNPIRSVTVSDFYIGKYEVTQQQWKHVMSHYKPFGRFHNPSNHKGDNLPVDNVCWDDVQEFIKKLNEQTGKKYRLPTEAEWEYAARGGNKSKGYKYAGSDNIDDVAWYGERRYEGKIRRVGTKRPNELGTHDMSGNVWEWTGDWYESDAPETATNPTGPPSGVARVIRGGSYYSRDIDTADCRVSHRGANIINSFGYTDGCYTMGFRLALSPVVGDSLVTDVIPEGGGAVSSDLDPTAYPAGITVRLTAAAAAGYIFKEWTGAATGTERTVSVKMAGDTKATAVFEQLEYGTFTDNRDGKTYKAVGAGDYIWMAENLNHRTDSSWCYDEDESNCEKYGRLYTWDAAIKACPAGWRLPDSKEWNYLARVFGSPADAADLATLELAPDWKDTDELGFSALRGGERRPYGDFSNIGSLGVWWTATEIECDSHIKHDNHCADIRSVYTGRVICGMPEQIVLRRDKDIGYSVRCIK
jgi:uncharacterized protein (TIGR02145 family)